MPKRLTRAQKKAQTREALLDAAASLIARHGYERTTLDQIAERAGLTRGAVYSNFTSKQELLFAVAGRVSTVFDDPALHDLSIEFPRRLRLYAGNLMTNWKTVREAVLLYSELEMLAARDAKVRRLMASIVVSSRQARGSITQIGANAEGIELPMGGTRSLTVVTAATLGLLRERIVTSEFVDEKLVGDALLTICGYDPEDHPMP